MEKIINVDNKYSELIGDLKEIIFGGTWAMIEMQHQLGKRILEEDEAVKTLVPHVAKDLNRSERSIYYAVQFAQKFPDINKLPEGKAITWRHIRNELLPGRQLECSHEETKEITICIHCGNRIKSVDN